MKIIAVSDSHFESNYLQLIRNRHLKETDLFIHCGDSQLSSTDSHLQGYLVVRGNCDFDKNLPDERLEVLNEQDQLLMTHGHHYDVKYSMQRLYYKALEVGATLVCYGHSHCIAVEMMDGILFLNPGSITLPRNTKEKTYASIELQPNSIKVSYLEVSTGDVLLTKKFNR